MTGFLAQAFIYLSAAVIAVPIAKRLGLGSVLGYLIAGIAIGPLLGLVGSETQDIQHFAEFGVVMMLFLVGLELEPRALWNMRRRLVGLGGLQLGVTTALITGFALFMGLSWNVALSIGLIFSLSSTAIVLQTLSENGQDKTEGGRASFSVLLFQDMAVIPMLALIPLLAMPELAGNTGDALAQQAGHGDEAFSFVHKLPSWASSLMVLGAVGVIVLGGHFLTRPLFRFIAQARLREVFTATALFLVIGIALLMTMVGLSPALGTFLAGVVLANSEYRHELESDIEPFKGLLLGLFFITVGAGINFTILFDNLFLIAGLTFGLMLTKILVLLVIARLFKIPGRDGWLFALSLAQAGEFGFVLLGFSVQNNVLPEGLSQTLLLVVALSMLLTPLLFILYEQVFAQRFASQDNREADKIDEKGLVIIAGHGRFGQIVNRFLRSNGYKTVVLDHHSDLVDGARHFGIKTFYGDASRPDLLDAAGLDHAKILVVAVDNKDTITDIVTYARQKRPELHIIARAVDRHHVYGLYNAGANDIVRETFDSSVRAGKYALKVLGVHPFRVEKAARVFIRDDRETLQRLAEVWDPDIPVLQNKAYAAVAKERNAKTDQAMHGENMEFYNRIERGWTPPPKPSAKRSE